jgi:hypothetical protein
LQDLLNQFVRVRLIQGNALDLSLFQFDYDLTFAAFFLNADRTIYGRYGSRSDQKEADKDISLDGFRKAMAGALELHKDYPSNSKSLAGKQGKAPRFKVPEDYPSLGARYKPTIDYEGKVAQSCLHCHQVREADRMLFRTARQAIPDAVLYPYPMPDTIGLVLDPKEKARVANVIKESPAAAAGFKRNDALVSLQGQPIISIADVQWILQNAPWAAKLSAVVSRSGKQAPLTIDLPEGWRRKTDISWRASTWDLRRMATGGLVLQELSVRERREAELPANALGLRISYVGQYNEHAAGKRAGFQKDDVIVRAGDLEGPMSESELLGHLLRDQKPGERLPVTVLRGEEPLQLQLPMQ